MSNNSPENTDHAEHHHDQDLTTSTKERWEYIGTLLATLMIASLPILTVGGAIGILMLTNIGQGWFALYATVTLMAATWAFGAETLETVRKVRGK
jgi:hypothetical protein